MQLMKVTQQVPAWKLLDRSTDPLLLLSSPQTTVLLVSFVSCIAENKHLVLAH